MTNFDNIFEKFQYSDKALFGASFITCACK